MQENLGARLRRRREEQHIALDAIARQTKIKLSLLEALERDDVSDWPSGLYRRAFVRAYAQAIGLDPDVLLREFVEVHPEAADVAAAEAIAATLEASSTSGGSPNLLRSLVGSAFSRMRRAPAAQASPAAEPAAARLLDEAAIEPPDLAGETLSPETGDEAVVRSDEAVAAAAAEPESTVHREPRPIAEPKSESVPAGESPAFDADLSAVARLCTQFCRVEHPDDVRPLLQEAARILDATGVIVWVWDPAAEELRPVLAHGYSERMLAQLPTVGRDADNPTAAAFRTAHTRAIAGTHQAGGALVLPLITPGGCGGVLAIELLHGREQTKCVRSIATIFAAALAQLVGGAGPTEALPEVEDRVPQVPDLGGDPSYRRAPMTH